MLFCKTCPKNINGCRPIGNMELLNNGEYICAGGNPKNGKENIRICVVSNESNIDEIFTDAQARFLGALLSNVEFKSKWAMANLLSIDKNLFNKHIEECEKPESKQDRDVWYRIKNKDCFAMDIFEFIFDKEGSIGGVYLIGNFYVGSSQNIKHRILHHARLCINGQHHNKDFEKRFMHNLRNGIRMPVSILSRSQKEENTFIQLLSVTMGLVNQSIGKK